MKQHDFLESAYYDKTVDIKCIKIKQPIGEFYIGSINSKHLKEITFSDVRRMEGERGFESYLGIQRPLSPSHGLKKSPNIQEQLMLASQPQSFFQ